VNRQQQIRGLQSAACRPSRVGHAVATQFGKEGDADRVWRRLTEVPFRTAQEMVCNLVPVDNPAPCPAGMKHETEVVRVFAN